MKIYFLVCTISTSLILSESVSLNLSLHDKLMHAVEEDLILKHDDQGRLYAAQVRSDIVGTLYTQLTREVEVDTIRYLLAFKIINEQLRLFHQAGEIGLKTSSIISFTNDNFLPPVYIADSDRKPVLNDAFDEKNLIFNDYSIKAISFMTILGCIGYIVYTNLIVQKRHSQNKSSNN